MADIRKGNFIYVICNRDVKEELAVTVYESGCAKPSVEVYTTYQRIIPVPYKIKLRGTELRSYPPLLRCKDRLVTADNSTKDGLSHLRRKGILLTNGII